MNDKFVPHNDPLTEHYISQVSVSVGTTIRMLARQYHYDAVVAIIMTGVGVTLGRMQALHEKHSQECDRCEIKNFEYHELAVKNFSVAFEHGKLEIEQEDKALAASADSFLERVLKEHGSK